MYIQEESSMLAAYSCMKTGRLLSFYTEVIWNLEYMLSIGAAQKQKTDLYVALMQNAHLSVWNADELINMFNAAGKEALQRSQGLSFPERLHIYSRKSDV